MEIDRKHILSEAIENCFREMYAKAQPAADWDNIIEEYKSGKIGKDETIYDRHYLSQEEFSYIVDKYMNAYRIKTEWKDDIEILEEYLREGGSKDKYIPEKTDPDGFVHPGYRSYEEVPPLKEQFIEIMKEWDCSEAAKEIAEKLYDTAMETIKNCKEFYKFDNEESKFRFSTALGASPTCNAETVKKWWKDNYDVDIEIEERNPLLFWEYDNYEDEMDEIMTEEYGENWKEIWHQKWEDEKAEKKRKHEEIIKELQKQNAQNEE